MSTEYASDSADDRTKVPRLPSPIKQYTAPNDADDESDDKDEQLADAKESTLATDTSQTLVAHRDAFATWLDENTSDEDDDNDDGAINTTAFDASKQLEVVVSSDDNDGDDDGSSNDSENENNNDACMAKTNVTSIAARNKLTTKKRAAQADSTATEATASGT